MVYHGNKLISRIIMKTTIKTLSGVISKSGNSIGLVITQNQPNNVQ
jgi:hypothetical protein